MKKDNYKIGLELLDKNIKKLQNIKRFSTLKSFVLNIIPCKLNLKFPNMG